MRKKSLLFLVLLAFVSLALYQLLLYGGADFFAQQAFETHDLDVRQRLHYSNYKFLLTDKFEKHVLSWDTFQQKPLVEKCTDLFQFLDTEQPDWHLHAFHGKLFDKSAVRKGSFFNNALAKLKKQKTSQKAADPLEITRDDKKRIETNFAENVDKTAACEQEMADTITILRLIGHCFFKLDPTSYSTKYQELYNRWSGKVAPFLMSELPQREKGDISPSAGKYYDESGLAGDGNLFDYFYRKMDGTGIVISAATRYTKDIVKFIHVLRALNNKLPIQILYRSDLLVLSKEAILLAASLSKEDLLGSQLSNQKLLNKIMMNTGFSAEHFDQMDFPKQDVTMVNMQRPLRKLARADFSSYNNKILALIFTSFEKVLLFDADAVPLLAPQDIMNLKEFTDTGAYFFRDRSLLDTNDWIETNYFAKMMPHLSSKLDMAMGVKPVTEHTLGNQYMKGWRHCQEAGLLLLDRKRHFSSLLTLLPLSLWGEPVKSSIWGDKEMYWLAMSLAGDEDYTFNKYNAASVGQATEQNQYKLYNNTQAAEVCSSHPGHVSLDGRLLWINSGFSHCKKNGFARDQNRFPYKAMGDREYLKNLFDSPLRIRHAIVPPDLPVLRPISGPPDQIEEVKFVSSLRDRKKDVDQIHDVDQILTYGPQKGWIKSSCCSNYQYCAYNEIEMIGSSGTIDRSGTLFTFNDADARFYDLLGAIWLSALRVSSLMPGTEKSEKKKDLPQSLKTDQVEGKEKAQPTKSAEKVEEKGKAQSTKSAEKLAEKADSAKLVPNPTVVEPSSSDVARDKMKLYESDDKSLEDENLEVKLLNHLGSIIWGSSSKGEEKEEQREEGKALEVVENSEESQPAFDQSEVKKRPEQLSHDMKLVLKKIKAAENKNSQ